MSQFLIPFVPFKMIWDRGIEDERYTGNGYKCARCNAPPPYEREREGRRREIPLLRIEGDF